MKGWKKINVDEAFDYIEKQDKKEDGREQPKIASAVQQDFSYDLFHGGCYLMADNI